MDSRRYRAAATRCLGYSTSRRAIRCALNAMRCPLLPSLHRLYCGSPRGWGLAHLYFLRLRVLRRTRRRQPLEAQRTFQGLLRTETRRAHRLYHSDGRARTSLRVRALRTSWKGRAAASAWRGGPRGAEANQWRPQPPSLGDTWVMASRRDRRDLQVSLLSARSYERINGAGDRGRTGDVQLGKLAFYH